MSDFSGDQKARNVVKIYNELNSIINSIEPKKDFPEITSRFKMAMQIITLLRASAKNTLDQETKTVLTNIWVQGAINLCQNLECSQDKVQILKLDQDTNKLFQQLEEQYSLFQNVLFKTRTPESVPQPKKSSWAKTIMFVGTGVIALGMIFTKTGLV